MGELLFHPTYMRQAGAADPTEPEHVSVRERLAPAGIDRDLTVTRNLGPSPDYIINLESGGLGGFEWTPLLIGGLMVGALAWLYCATRG